VNPARQVKLEELQSLFTGQIVQLELLKSNLKNPVLQDAQPEPLKAKPGEQRKFVELQRLFGGHSPQGPLLNVLL
jgi:hypothetical protein